MNSLFPDYAREINLERKRARVRRIFLRAGVGSGLLVMGMGLGATAVTAGPLQLVGLVGFGVWMGWCAREALRPL